MSPVPYLSEGLQAVDRIQIRVLIDNVTDSLSSNPAFTETEWAALRAAGMTELDGERVCCASHGLSLVIRCERNGKHHTLMFDAGADGYVVQRNGFRLGLDFGAIEAAVLSHGHWDHAGGLPMAVSLIRQQNGGQDVPLYVHPDMFRQRGARYADGAIVPHRAIPSIQELEQVGAQVVADPNPLLLLDRSVFLSGEIPRVTPYETGYASHLRRSVDGTSWEPDPLIMDERFLAVHVRHRGLVVFSACSHAGVVNVLHHARDLFPSLPLYAVVGGLHLSGPSESRIADTVAGIRRYDLRYIMPAHCTGWRAVNALATAFGESSIVPVAVGKGFTFDGTSP